MNGLIGDSSFYIFRSYKDSPINYFWSVKDSVDVTDNLTSVQVPFSTIDSNIISTLYTTVPHKPIRECIHICSIDLSKSLFVLTYAATNIFRF